jgi:hypothetical protein
MTAFADFLDAARAQLAAPPAQVTPGGEDLRETAASLRRLAGVLMRYTDDITTSFGTQLHPAPGKEPEPWLQAAAQARRYLARAGRYLTPHAAIRTNPGARATISTATRIGRAASLLQAGRELLDTHFTTQPDGVRAPHTEWAASLTTPALRQALLPEITSLARLAAASSGRLANAPGWRGAPATREALAAASRCLHDLHDSARTASDGPVPAAHAALLRAIPPSQLPARSLPAPRHDITALCQGAIASAQRIRRAAWHARPGTAPPPATIATLRQLANASAATSHHCHLLLHAAATRATADPAARHASTQIEQAAQALAHARDRWQNTAQILDRFTTTPHHGATPAAAEAGDLATWTGRLAYADPAWTLTAGPAATPRNPASLTPELADIPQIIAVTHHAATALETAAAAGHDQLQAAARAERLLVPARSLPHTDTTRPVPPAPRDRVRDLLFTYRTAGQATADATTTLAVLAARSAAPSRTLTTHATLTPPPQRPWHHGPGTIPDWQGPLETSIRDLGATSPWLLQRAIALDQASTQLLLDAAAEPAKRPRKRHASPDASASTPAQEPHASQPAGPADREPEP